MCSKLAQSLPTRFVFAFCARLRRRSSVCQRQSARHGARAIARWPVVDDTRARMPASSCESPKRAEVGKLRMPPCVARVAIKIIARSATPAGSYKRQRRDDGGRRRHYRHDDDDDDDDNDDDEYWCCCCKDRRRRRRRRLRRGQRNSSNRRGFVHAAGAVVGPGRSPTFMRAHQVKLEAESSAVEMRCP